MKVLITGTNGFVGKNLMEYFQGRIDDLHCPKRQQLNLLDSSAVFDYIEEEQFDIVIHCGVNIYSVEENLKMYFNLERCSSFFGKMFCVGSGSEYDMRNYIPRMKEDYFLKNIPADVYGFSKYVIAKDIEGTPRNIYNLRVFGIFGKYEDYRRRFITNNICRVLCNLDISMNKNMYFDYLYVDDFSRIVEMLMDKYPIHRSYNICANKSIDLLSLAEIIRHIDGNRANIIVKEKNLNPEYSGDNSRFINEFGKFDYTNHEDAISYLYNWYSDSKNINLNPKDFS
jgi:GDP-L-fucose synthase|tara:strand:- start:497 stop:1348 length:852 start_codon:yes stop_codon:yes gene_type:complete